MSPARDGSAIDTCVRQNLWYNRRNLSERDSALRADMNRDEILLRRSNLFEDKVVNKAFYVRAGNASQPLTVSQAARYIQDKFKD